jgi:plasmid stabilization system protein ParE
MVVEYHPLAVSDLNNAVAAYDQQQSRLGNEFRAEVYAAIERIRSGPLTYATVQDDLRRCLVRRFPYSLVFRVVGDDTLRILVIRHHRRRPGYGLARR